MRNLERIGVLALTGMVALAIGAGAGAKDKAGATPRIVPVVLSDAQWRARLTAEQFRVLRREGTEVRFTGKYLNQHASGTYVCAGCGLELFSSRTKFESGTGWPSFWQPIARGNVREVPDSAFGQVFTEIECARCGGHLGHVFPDGPEPTGRRYCMNSAALNFVPAR